MKYFFLNSFKNLIIGAVDILMLKLANDGCNFNDLCIWGEGMNESVFPK